MHRSSFAFLGLSLFVLGCARGNDTAADTTTARSDGQVPYAYERLPLDTARPAGAVIDSVFPMPEMIRRFRAGLPATTSLVGAAPTRDSLLRAFVAALATRDARTLGQLTFSRAEFAYLYIPAALELQQANGLPPQRLWDQLTLASEKGIGRALDRIGGKPLTLQGANCPTPPVSLGALKLQAGCTIQLRAADGTEFNGKLFGSIVEHAGGFKFLGYANDM